MHRGFVKLWRKIKDWEWYKKSETFHLFMHLLLTANHKTSRYQGIEILRGQVVAGRKLLSVETGISEQSIRTSLERLKSTNEITIESTNTFSVITLCNYDTYNDLIECINQPNSDPVNQRSTNDQPTINQRSTTSKECKNIKNEKNEKNIIPPLLEWVIKFCEERKNGIDPESFFNHYETRGWVPKGSTKKMSNWQSAIITWEKNKKENVQQQNLFQQNKKQKDEYKQDITFIPEL